MVTNAPSAMPADSRSGIYGSHSCRVSQAQGSCCCWAVAMRCAAALVLPSPTMRLIRPSNDWIHHAGRLDALGVLSSLARLMPARKNSKCCAELTIETGYALKVAMNLDDDS